eukprot:g14757.t1
MEKDVHLPSTSLSALTQLQELVLNHYLLLDIASSRDFQFTELFSAILTELGKDVPGSIVQEAELLLNEHPYVTQDPRRWNEKTPSKDGAVGESMDIFLCSAGTGLDRPVLALARLKMEASICFQVEEGTGEMRFAAVVLSDLNSEQSGRALARALATTFMDEEFSSVARSAPKEKPETIREALRAYLAKLTIVPTVNLNKAGHKQLRFKRRSESINEAGGSGCQGSNEPKRRQWEVHPREVFGFGHPTKNELGDACRGL